jgi:hypothetical protein
MHEYLGLERGRPMFRQDFTCPALLKDLIRTFAYGAVTRSGRAFQRVLLAHNEATGLIPVRSPLLGESHVDVLSCGY